jgi:hypothetical protein
MFRILLGSIAAAIAMFIAGFIFFATPFSGIAYSSVSEVQQASAQAALAANLPATGTYMIPSPSTAEGAVMYGKGPIATVHFNTGGFSAEDPMTMIYGLGHMFVVALLMGIALAKLDRRIPDFASRARIVVFFAIAANMLAYLGEPIWYRHDWTYALYQFVAQTVMLAVGGLIIARWFLPVAAELTAEQVQKPISSQEVPPVSVAQPDGEVINTP